MITIVRPPPLDMEYVRLRQATTYAGWSECLNGNVEAGQPAKLSFCRRSTDQDIKWKFEASTGHLINQQSGLCLDAVHKPPHKYVIIESAVHVVLSSLLLCT